MTYKDLNFYASAMPASKPSKENRPVLKPEDLKILQELGARLDESELCAASIFLYSRAERRFHPENCLDLPDGDDVMGMVQSRKREWVHRVNEAVDEIHAATREQPTWRQWWINFHALRQPTPTHDFDVNVGFLRGWCTPEETERFDMLIEQHGIRTTLVKRSEFEKMWNEHFEDLPELITKR